MFAPAPTANYQLFVDYYDDGWQRVDVFNELVSRHQANRLRGYEPLVVAFSNSIHYFEKNSVLQQPLNGPVKNDLNFTMLERAVQNYLRFTRTRNTQPKRLILLVVETGTHKNRIYFN